MPQVPYKPFASVSPTMQGAPEFRINTPGAAFGETVFHALKGLGQVTEQAGSEMFTRAMALQQLRNETEAREADANYMMAVGDKHAQFSALQGKSAVDAFPKYSQDLQDMRKQFRDGLSNDAARKMFDSSALSTMGRTIFNGAGHAATQNKMWAAGAAKSQMSAAQDNARFNLHDDKGFEADLQKIEESARHIGDIKGIPQDSDEIKQDIFQGKSAAYANRIIATSKENPIKAKAQLEQAIGEHLLHTTDYDRAQRIVTGELHGTGSRVIADKVIKESQDHGDFFNQRGTARVEGLHPEFSTRLRSAIQDAEQATREKAEIDSLVRTTREQKEIFERHQRMPGGVIMHPAAPPGTSQHELGKAADIKEGPVLDWLHEHAEDYGLEFLKGRTGARDPGHIQLSAKQPKEGLEAPKEESEQSLVGRARAEAQKIAPDDATFHDMAEARVRAQYNAHKQYQRDEDFKNRNMIDGALAGNFGNVPVTVEELKASNPKVAQAWDSLNDTQRLRYMKAIGKVRPGADDRNEYTRLVGMAHNNPAEFVDEDLTANMKISPASFKHFTNLQAKLKEKPESDPRISKAMELLKPALTAAGLTRKDKERYDQFTGALQDQLESYLSEHKKSMPPAEIQRVGAQLMQQQVTSEGWLWNSRDNMFAMPVPKAERGKAEEALKKAFPGVTPSEEQIQRLFVQKKFKELYGGAAR